MIVVEVVAELEDGSGLVLPRKAGGVADAERGSREGVVGAEDEGAEAGVRLQAAGGVGADGDEPAAVVDGDVGDVGEDREWRWRCWGCFRRPGCRR